MFVLLAGIVFFNVDLLQMNRDIARDADRISALKRENARLLLDEARLASSERIQESAALLGLVLPAPGEVRYLKARPTRDAGQAVKRITEPNLTLRRARAGGAGARGAEHRSSGHRPGRDRAAHRPGRHGPGRGRSAATTPTDPAATAAPTTTTAPAG